MDQISDDTLMAVVIASVIMVFMRFRPQLMAWGIPFLSAEAVKNRMDAGEDVLFIDVRSAKEFIGELGHVSGALNLDAGSLADRLKELGDQLAPHMNDPVVVACRTQNRSPRAAKLLRSAGFKDVVILKDGMSGWNRAGYPILRG